VLPGRPRSACSRSASQAPPDQMPTSTASGCSRPRTPGAQLGVQRLGVKLQHRRFTWARQVLQNCSRMTRRRRHRRLARRRPAPRWCCSARPPRAPAAEAAVQLAGEARARRCCRARRRRGGSGTPTTSASGCHSAISGDGGEARIAFGGMVAAAGLAQQRVAAGHADAASAEVEGQKGEGITHGGRGQTPAQACPASCDSMRGSKPSSDSARS
jgi:hypothetical protein